MHAGRRYVDPEIAASELTENGCPLTARELEILTIVRTGVPVATVAGAMHLAPGTVRNYLSVAMAKLGVGFRRRVLSEQESQRFVGAQLRGEGDQLLVRMGVDGELVDGLLTKRKCKS